MKNLFSEKNNNYLIAKYKKLGIGKDLSERIYTSRLLGSDTNLVLHGGGNTSVKSKIKDIDGETHEIIYVKGSGSDLSDIGPRGFPAVKIQPILKLMKKKFISDEEMVSFIRKNLVDISSPNPSVETLVHAIIKEKFVDHTHSNAILEITNRPDGNKLCKKLFGKNFIIIPYVMPGYLLAKKVHQMYKQNKNLHGLILFRHGIFTFAENSFDSYKRMIDTVNIAEKFLKKQKTKKLEKIKTGNLFLKPSMLAPVIKSFLGPNKNYILNFRVNKQLLSSINNKKLEFFLNKGVVTPDHVIRTKPNPMIINFDRCKNLEDVKKTLDRKFIAYKKNYEDYFNKNKSNNKILKSLDPIPQIILIQNLGMFSIGRSLKEAVVNGDVSEMSIKTILRIEERSSFKSINKKDIFDVEYWSLEQAKLNKISKKLSGKVAVITGGAGTIGLAIAEKMKLEGAEVVILDNNKSKIEHLKVAKNFDAYICDVTKRDSVKKILAKICITYGGLDILVSNAGFAIQSSMINISDLSLKNSFDINFFAHQIIASESVKIMINQKKGGCLLFNISKQSVNPGINFGSYGTPKAALLALCKQYALEYGQYKIRSNGVNADRIQSGLLTKKMIKKRADSRKKSVEQYLKGNLLNEKVTAKDVAKAFYNLSISLKTTAAIHTVDGGNIEASLR